MKIYTKVSDQGNIADNVKKQILRELKKLSKSYIEIRILPVGKKRSDLQNAYYWGVVINYITDAINILGNNLNPDQVHELLKLEIGINTTFFVKGVKKNIVKSTTKYTTLEFEEYLEKCRIWALDMLNINIPLPNEY